MLISPDGAPYLADSYAALAGLDRAPLACPSAVRWALAYRTFGADGVGICVTDSNDTAYIEFTLIR